MKHLLFLIVMAIALFARPVFYKDFDKAKEMANLENKPIALFIVSYNCPHCHNLINSIKRNKQFIRFMTNNFEWVIIDIASRRVPEGIEFNGKVPAIYSLMPNGEMLTQPITGEIPINYLYQYFSNVLKGYYQIAQNLQNTR